MSPVVSKVFEAVLLRIYQDYLVNDQLQFVFKEKSSCTDALSTVIESVKYFTRRGSKVYCGFLDASKAFDKVLHSGFFKIAQRKCLTFVRILYNWYSNSHCSVCWNNINGESFVVKCGVR